MHNAFGGVEFGRHDIEVMGIMCIISPKDRIGHMIGELNNAGRA
jgi:hypothetical protein